MNKNSTKFSTKCMHYDETTKGEINPIVSPIYTSSTYVLNSISDEVHNFEYSRLDNPNRQNLEQCLAKLENGTNAFAFASGMSAIDAIFRLLNKDDHIICISDLYGETFRLIKHYSDKFFRLAPSIININSMDALKAAFTPKTKMIYLESISNPLLKIPEFNEIVEFAKKNSIITVCDNTFATPFLLRPLDMGVDIVVHSTTKFINGHSDVIGGVVIIKDNIEAMKSLATIQTLFGAVPSPFDCYLILRSIETLALRMKQSSDNAMMIAKEIQNHSKINRIFYPGLVSHTQYSLVKKYMSSFGSIITFEIKGGITDLNNFINKLRIFKFCPSFGGNKSIISHPASMSHKNLTQKERLLLGITPTMLRISTGIEDVEDLLADLLQALK